MTESQSKFVDEVRKFAMNNYEAGGDIIVETFTDDEIVKEFENMEQVRDYIGLKLEVALNKRWGDESDQELERWKRWQESK